LATIPVTNPPDMSHRHLADGFAETYCLKKRAVFGLHCEVLDAYYEASGTQYYDFAVYVIIVNEKKQALTYAYRSGKWFLERLSIQKSVSSKTSIRIDAPIEKDY
jgi:hypothetical protein